jgi:hypothetical protein
MKANIYIDETEALFPVTHIIINININVPKPAKLKNKTLVSQYPFEAALLQNLCPPSPSFRVPGTIDTHPPC